MSKHHNWRERLHLFMHDLLVQNNQGNVEFSWESHPSSPYSFHCISFGSKIVEVQTGKDLYENMLGGAYFTNATGAYKALLQMGYKSMPQLLGSLFQEVRPSYAQTGDLLLVPGVPEGDLFTGDEQGFNYAVALADPPNYWVISRAHGLSRGSILDVRGSAKAYRVE